VTETIVTVLKFEHRETAEILVQTAFFLNLSIPFVSNFVSIVSVTTGIFFYFIHSGIYIYIYIPVVTKTIETKLLKNGMLNFFKKKKCRLH
jgi:hypothetical protein